MTGQRERENAAYPLAKLEELAKWAYRFSPLVAPDLPEEIDKKRRLSAFEDRDFFSDDPRYNGINLDISGCKRLFKGEKNLLDKVKGGLSSLGIGSRLAIAPTLGAAWAVSRYGPKVSFVAEKHELSSTLAPLPIRALRLERKTEQALQEVGIFRINDLLLLRRSSLLTRFGPRLNRRLNQALGVEEELLSPIRIAQPLYVQKHFDSAITDFQIICRIAEALLNRLLEELAEQSKKVSLLCFEAQGPQGFFSSKELSLSLPSSNKSHLWTLLKSRLERLDFGLGMESIRLIAEKTENIKAKEIVAGKAPASDRLFGEMLDTLSEHLGKDNILCLKCFESHIPEKSFAYTAFTNNSSPNAARIADAKRPTILFPAPRPIHALSLLPDKAPAQLRWKGCVYPILTALGPERIAPLWWGSDESLFCTRDYFRIQLSSGLWLWIFRELETSRWFIHGLWV